MADQITFDEKAVAESWNRNIKLRNELAAQAGQPDNLEIGVGDATKALGGSTLSSVGGMVKNLSLGDASRALRSVVDGSYMQGNVDSAVQAVSGKTSGELAQKGLLTDALGLGDVQFTGVEPSQNPVKEAASSVVNKAANVGTAAADKLDQYVVKPISEPVGKAIQAGGEAIKESMSPDAKLAAKSQFYTEDENGFHLGDAWGDPAKMAIRFSDVLGTLAPTVLAALVTQGAVAPMITKSVLKRGVSEVVAKQVGKIVAEKAAQNVVLAGGVGMSIGQSADQAREAVSGLSHEELMNSPTFRENVRLVNDDPANQLLNSTQRLDLARERTADAAASYARSDPTTYAGAVAGTVLGDSLLFKMITGKKEAAQVTGNILARTAKGFFKGGVGEGSGEAIEEGMQKNIANRASNAVGGTNIDPMEGVVLAGMEAGTLGVLSGGSVGAYSADVHGSSKPAADTSTTTTTTPPAGPQTTVPSTAVSDVDVNTAIKEVSDGRKVAGSFSIGKGPEGYRAAYINQGGELRVTQPFATAEEAQQAAIQTTQPLRAEALQTTAQPTPEPTVEPDDLADVPAYLRQDSISDELKAATQRTQATPNDPAFAQALAAEEQGVLAPIEKTVTGDPNEPAYTRTGAPLSEVLADPTKSMGGNKPRTVSGELLPEQQGNTLPATVAGQDGVTVDGQSEEIIPESRRIGQSDTIFAGGPAGDGVNTNYVPPVTADRVSADQSLGQETVIDPRAPVGQAIENAGNGPAAIFDQLKTVRVTKKGKPFASQKEAQMASRQTETPIELPTGGFGVVEKAELEQALSQWGQQPQANFEGGMPQNQAVPFDAPNQSRNENAMKGRDEEYGIDVELNQDKDGFVLTKTDSNGQATEKRIGSGLGGVYLGRLILNKDGEFVQPSQIIQSSTGMSDPSTTPFKGTQEQRQAVVKLVAEIEFYRGIGDMGKVEQLEQKLFNVVNGNNTNSTTQSSESSDQAAPINLPTDQKIVGTPPATGLVVAAIGADGKLYIGGKRDIHGILSVKYGDEIRQRAGLKAGESTWSKQGFVGPDGVFMDREQAFSVAKKANPKLKLSENMDGELDALDYQESTPVNQPTDQTEATTSPEPTTTTVAETTSPPITSDLSQDIPDTELETQTAAGKAPEQAPQAPDKKQEETPWTSAETNKYGTINLTGDQNVLRQWATANNVTFGTTKNGIVVAKSSVPYVQSLIDQEADHGNTTQRVTNDTGLPDRAGDGDRGTSPQSDTGPTATEPSNGGGRGTVTTAINESADGDTGSVGGGRNGNDHAVTEKSISVNYGGSKFTLDLPDSPLNMSTEEVSAEYKNKHPEIRDSKGKVVRDALGEMVQKEHARLIKEAISKGKPVSDAALEDYRALIRPDLNANQLDLLSDDWITKKRAGDFKTTTESVNYIRNWGKEVTGKQTTVHTPSGKPVQTEYRLMEADELIASHDFDGNVNRQFPQHLQPRDRSRATARNQLYQIAQNPVPERLTDSAESDRGAPIVKGGIVESGNGRVIGLKEAYRRGNAVAYKQYLADHAGNYGLTAEQVNAMTNPVLVRERLTDMTPDQVREFTVDSNKGAGLSLGATEQANADAAALTNEILGKLAIPENGDVLSRENDGFLNAFGALLGNNELAQYKTADGAWNQAFKKRVENAIFAKGYGNQELLAEIAESTKPDVKNILTGLMNVSGKLAELRTINNETGATLANVFADAAGVVARSRREGVSVSEALAQNDMFGGGVNSEAGVLAEWLDTNARSAKKISDVLGRLTSDLLDNARNQDQADIFTGQPATPRTVKDAINDEQTRQNQQAANNQQKPGADLFGANPPRLDTGKNGSVQSPAEQGRTGTKPEVKPEAKSKIADFGEKIGGAKKDVWQSIKDSMQGNTKEEIAALPLSKIWPVPDYQNMLDTGTDPWVVALVRSARDIIPAKPRDSYKVSRWSDQVKTLRELAVQVAEGALNSQTARLKIHEADMQSRAPASLAGLIDLYMTVGHSKDLSTLRISSGEFSMLNGVEYKPAKSLWYVEQRAPNRALGNWPRMVVTGNSRAELLANFKEKFNELPSQPTPKQQTTFEIYSYGDGRGYFVGKKLGRHPVVLSETFTNVKDARDYRANHQAELADKLEKYKEIPKVRRDTNEPRVGEDMRGGEDVTPEMFGNVFGFRGVEFGNWVEQKRRQKDLNDAYDALMDLAAVLNIPPKALSLNGKLSMAFGARGSGGIDAAAAHFEPTKVVINLTKTNGAGSLGHEWWHALDNYFSSLRNHQGGVEHMTEARDVRLASHGSNYVHSGAVRNDMIAAFGKVLEAIHSTEVVDRSAKLDARRSKDYWTTEPELSARSFETYLINKLQDQDASNDYLANITTQEAWDGLYSLENDDGKGSYPYPNEKEIAAIRGAFDNFFSVIDHRTDEDGKVALFSTIKPTTAEKAGKGMKEQEARLAAKEWLKQFKTDIKVEVVADQKAFAAAMAAHDYAFTIQAGEVDNAAYLPTEKTILINASAISSPAKLREMMRHEILVHHGLRYVVGGDYYNKVINAIKQGYNTSKAIRKAANIVDKNYPDADIMTAYEELFAHYAQNRPSDLGVLGRFWRGIKRLIQTGLEKVGFIKVNESEKILDSVLDDIAENMRNGIENGMLVRGPNAKGKLPPKSINTPMFSRTAVDDELMTKIGLGQKEDLFEKAQAKLATLKQADGNQIKEWVRKTIRKANTQILDAFAPIKYAEDNAGKVDASDSGYIATRLAAGSSSVMNATMLYGLPEWKDGVIQRKANTGEKDALLGIFEDLGPDLHNWLAWMAGHRAEALKAEGRENLLTDEDIKALKDKGNGKDAQFMAAKAKWNAMNKAVLDLGEEAGLFTAQDRKGWESEWYIPFFRETESGDVTGPYKHKGIANQSSGIKKLKGGTSNVNDLLENIFVTTSNMIDASMKNMAAQKVVYNLADTDLINVITKPNLMDIEAALKNKRNLMIVRVEGERYVIQVNEPDLFNAMTLINQDENRDPFRKLAMAAKHLLTAGVTASPDFIMRNFLRDAASTWAINEDGFAPMVDSIRGVKKALQMNDSSIDMMFSGASFMGGNLRGTDPEAMASAVRKALRRKGMSPEQIDRYQNTLITTGARAKEVLAQYWDKYERFGEAVENGSREAVYEAAIKAGKSHAQAAFEARDLMDFSMRGSSAVMRYLVDILPFFNARMQGLGKLGRAIAANPGQVARRGGMIAGASLALLAANWDDDRYEELPDWDKDLNWHFWLGDDHFRIPKPFEIGLLFGTLPERMVRTMGGKDTAAKFGEVVARNMLETFAINPVPQVIKPITEAYFNYDMFRGAPIENMSDLNVTPEARYDERTSLLMRELADATGMSPKKLEHIITGYTGTIGAYVVAMGDMLVRKVGDYGETPSWRADQIPVLKSVYQGSAPAKSTQSMQDFYKLMDETNQLYATIKQYKKEGRTEDAAELENENQDALRNRKQINKVQLQFRAIRNEMEMIQRDKSLTDEEKRVRIDRLLSRRNDLASKLTQRFGGQ